MPGLRASVKASAAVRPFSLRFRRSKTLEISGRGVSATHAWSWR